MGGHKAKDRRTGRRLAERPVYPRNPGHGHEQHVCEPRKCEHWRSPLAIEIAAEIKALIKAKLPPRTYAAIDSCMGHIDVKVLCSGHVSMTVEHCVLDPDHEGECFSLIKGARHFVPDGYF